MLHSQIETRFSWLWLLISAAAGLACGDDVTNPGSDDGVVNADVVADTYAVTSENRFVMFNRASGEIRSSSSVAGLEAGEEILGIDFRPADAALYAVGSSGNLYVVDLVRGQAIVKSTLAADPTDTSSPFSALDGEAFGVNFNPVADRLRVVSDNGQNLRINVDTGATTTDASLNPGTPSVSAAAYSNSFSAACRTRLYVVDISTNTLFLQDPPNAGTLTEIGKLRTPLGATWAGFKVVTGNDGASQALAVLPAEGGASIYDIDLTTAELDNPRSLALRAGESVRGTSAAPPATAPVQPPGELLGVSVANRLVSFNRGAPGKLCTNAPIAGLEANEDVLGIDIRPADGSLYALGSAGNIYTLDVPTGAATLKTPLVADPTDVTAPYTALPASDFGVGFNPVPDRLRAVSREGDNLRINVDTGVTVTDSSMSPTSMAVTAVAYTNAFAGATTTTLFAVDAAAGALTRIGGDPASGGACPADANNPNCGNVTSLGSLGVDGLRDVSGFDIDGTPEATTTAFLALTIGNATSSSLYVVDLATGAAAPPAGVANATVGGGQPLREITLAANPVVAPAP